MVDINVLLTEKQMAELLFHVDVSGYVLYMTMDEWDDYMDGKTATEIMDSTGGNYFNTADMYAVQDGIGNWFSTDSLQEILEPHVEVMLQEFIDSILS